jgi:porin
VLDDLQVFGDLDLDKAVGWKGATAHFQLLNNSGAMPNDDAGTLQGVDNIEVGRQRARVFEAWVEQGFGDKGSVRAGLYDLNSEFYANDSAGLLLAPAFGIGSELAATGPNGPSIFPSTALAVRLRWTPNEHLYAQAAALNANAGVLGDPGGIKTSFDNGVLLIAEAGWTGRGKVAFGTWRYTDKQDDIRFIAPTGDPAPATAKGAYVLLERRLTGGEDDAPRKTTAFARLGVSDGDTTAFKGGWQAGVLVERVLREPPRQRLLDRRQPGAFCRASTATTPSTPASAWSARKGDRGDLFGQDRAGHDPARPAICEGPGRRRWRRSRPGGDRAGRGGVLELHPAQIRGTTDSSDLRARDASRLRRRLRR